MTYSFPDDLNITPIDERMRRWRLNTTFTMYLDDFPLVQVQEGFVTDFASIPRFLWSILPPTGRYGKPAIIHDYLYRIGSYSRKQTDKIFLVSMKDSGVPWLRRHVMHRAVRMFAWGIWRKYRKGVKS